MSDQKGYVDPRFLKDMLATKGVRRNAIPASEFAKRQRTDPFTTTYRMDPFSESVPVNPDDLRCEDPLRMVRAGARKILGDDQTDPPAVETKLSDRERERIVAFEARLAARRK